MGASMTAWVPWLGYAASAIVAVSLLQVSIVKLRILNLIGCLLFLAYGLFLPGIAWPIVVANGFIAGVNIWFLTRMFRTDLSMFTYVPIDERRRFRLYDFIEANRADIVHSHPWFNERLLEAAFAGHGRIYLALKRFNVVGFSFAVNIPEDSLLTDPEEQQIMAYVRSDLLPEHTVYLNVDYVAPKYRDIGLAQKMYDELEKDLSDKRYVIALNIHNNHRHERFLRSHAYLPQKAFGGYTLYVKKL
jgi:ribosomal protein S18 acetylase RimI-like enzyme